MIFIAKIILLVRELKRQFSVDMQTLHTNNVVFLTSISFQLVYSTITGRSAFKILKGTPAEKSHLGWEDNITMDLKGIAINTRNHLSVNNISTSYSTPSTIIPFIRKAIEWTVIITEEFHSCLLHIKVFKKWTLKKVSMQVIGLILLRIGIIGGPL